MELFWVSKLVNGSIELDEMEMRHLKVLRKKEGDIIRICDGKGKYSDAVILNIGKRTVDLQVNEIYEVDKKMPSLTLMISPLKNADRFEWMLEKATELGVDTIIPIICERTESPLRKMSRLQRIIRSATMQSLQYYSPELMQPMPFSELSEMTFPYQKFIAWCEGDERKKITEAMKSKENATILIGPEGDFTKNEVDMALNLGFEAISLGENRLRTETAGVVAASVFYMKNI